MRYIKNTVKICDFVSVKSELYINGKTRVNTILGEFLSLTVMILGIAALGFF